MMNFSCDDQMAEYVCTMTLEDVVLDNGPEGWERASLYVFRDGETVFYVGKSKDISTRLCEHITGIACGWGGYQTLVELIADNFPDSQAWVVDLYSSEAKHTGWLEGVMIRTMRPVLNVMYNDDGQALPEKYKTTAYIECERQQFELRKAALNRLICDDEESGHQLVPNEY